ncbi:3-oxo-5-alpha-steroid 4-dehydrogenase-domain-containing protein [Endogone sp. FLAS-F59071]|nr:3-oxo-5-alpha-steroid 4-dehydrogenase-domain-containing protein [Endogone sp. FLAS-F59071]|eukprot:RUS20383.1 3-oxo-5-alpha-steroid 4-dehydrogenase-domain-containing protein [Endogone sp. FLAS-F59071]
MKINLLKRSSAKSNPTSTFLTLELPGSASAVTVDALADAIHQRLPKFYPDRQRVTTEDKQVLEHGSGKSLADFGVQGEETTLYFKDLGPQASWRTVFIIEYMGPFLFHPLLYFLPKLFYGSSFTHSPMQTATYCLVLLHFAKRELETIFVHRFSHGTMPFHNIFKNSAHYWLLSGANLAYWVYGPWFAEGTAASERSEVWLWGCVAVWAWAEISNLANHMTLRNLRPPGTRARAIPYGYGFDLVSCPNYFFEFVAWSAICVLTFSFSALLFNVVATAQMYVWAVKKHKQYRKEFKSYPRMRKAMFPFIA